MLVSQPFFHALDQIFNQTFTPQTRHRPNRQPSNRRILVFRILLQRVDRHHRQLFALFPFIRIHADVMVQHFFRRDVARRRVHQHIREERGQIYVQRQRLYQSVHHHSRQRKMMRRKHSKKNKRSARREAHRASTRKKTPKKSALPLSSSSSSSSSRNTTLEKRRRGRRRRHQHHHLYKKLPLEDESPFLFQSHFRRGIGSGLSGVFLQRLREFPQLVPFSRLRVVGVVGVAGGATSSSTRRGHRHRRALLRVNVYDVHTRRKSRYRIVCVP